MNNNAKKWVAALRSGDYEQGFNRLGTVDRDKIRYCCLGVGCELFIEAGGKLEKLITDGVVIYIERDMDDKPITKNMYLPPVVKEWLGIDTDAGRFKASGGNTTLAYEQDIRQKTFEQLADIIESEPEGLFYEENKNSK